MRLSFYDCLELAYNFTHSDYAGLPIQNNDTAIRQLLLTGTVVLGFIHNSKSVSFSQPADIFRKYRILYICIIFPAGLNQRSRGRYFHRASERRLRNCTFHYYARSSNVKASFELCVEFFSNLVFDVRGVQTTMRSNHCIYIMVIYNFD